MNQVAARRVEITARHVHVAAFVVLAAMLLSSMAMATTTDTTFLSAQTMITSWVTGSYGKLIAVGGVMVGLGVWIFTKKGDFAIAAVAIALFASLAPAILVNIFGVTM